MSHWSEDAAMLRKRTHQQKRQRVSVTSVVEDVPTTTSARVRTTAVSVTEEEPAEETTTTRRIRTTAAVVESTTSLAAAIPGGPTPAVQTSSTSIVQNTPIIATVPTTAPIATTALPVTPITPTTTRSTSSRIISSSASSSIAPLASNAAANDATTSSDSSNFPTGAVVGAAVGLVALLALLAGFFIWRKKRANRNAAALGKSGYTREKSMDGSDIFPGGANQRSSQGHGEKGSPIQQEDFSMQIMPAPQHQMMQEQNNHPAARQSWSKTNNYAAMPLPSPAVFPMPPSNSYPNIPHSASAPVGFAPPKAAMMGTPSTRSSVANPYGAIAAAGLTSPQLNQQQQQQDEVSPFEDPKWANKLFTVTRTFEPSMPDELVIYPGDAVKILMAYDDGWVLGENLSAMQQNGGSVRGVFPRDCVEELTAKPVEAKEDMPLSEEPASLTRAPTLPPLNLGRDSQSFTSAISSSSNDKRASQLNTAQQQPTRYSRASLVPVIDVSAEDDVSGPLRHLSTSSSLNGAIDRFPATPARQLTPVVEDGASSRSLKRTSSLMASKDQQDLFAQLGDVMGRPDSDGDESEDDSPAPARKM